MSQDAIPLRGGLIWRPGMLAAAGLAVAGLVISLRLDGGPLGPLLRFTSVALLGWMTVAGAITLCCGLGQVVVSLPNVLGDLHALSRFALTLSIGNARRRWPALFVTLTLDTISAGRPLPSPTAFIGRLESGETTRRAWLVTIRARGAFEVVGVRATALFPGSPFRAAGTAPLARRLTVLPAIYRLDRKALELLQGRRLAGGRLHAIPAASEDFLGVRLYRPGDNPRHIHAALSMRLAEYPLQQVVREFEDPSADDVVVLLDNAPSAADAGLGFQYRREKAISFTVALCRLLCEQKYRVRFGSVDEAGHEIVIPVERPGRDLSRLEARLALLGAAPAGTSLLARVRREAKASNAAILVVSLDHRRLERVHPALPSLTITPQMQTALTREVSAA